MSSQDQNERYRQRMQRKKEMVDSAIANADQERGIVLVLTGNGKGKSSSAFGMVARACGHGLKPAVVQFIKGHHDTGEERFFRDSGQVDWVVAGEGFTWETQDKARDAAMAQAGWEQARQRLVDPAVDLLVLDEVTYPIKYGYLDVDAVVADIQSRPTHQHVVITGRTAHAALRSLADTITEMQDEKHAFRAGVRAQKGVDL